MPSSVATMISRLSARSLLISGQLSCSLGKGKRWTSSIMVKRNPLWRTRTPTPLPPARGLYVLAQLGKEMENAKPPRKPKNRPRAIQKKIDVIKSLNQNILIFTISYLNSNFLHTGFLQDIFPGSYHAHWEREWLDVVNNGDKKPFVEDEDSNPAAVCLWTLRTRSVAKRNGKVVNLAQSRRVAMITTSHCPRASNGSPETCPLKLDNSSGDHPKEDDGSNQVQQISPIKAPIGGDDDIELRKKWESSELSAAAKEKVLNRFSGEDIEVDFTAITGPKTPRKPKNRPRAIQKKIDNSFFASLCTAASHLFTAVLEAASSTIKTGSSDRSNDGDCDESNCPPSSNRSSELLVLDDISLKPWVERIEKAFPLPAAMEVTPSRFEVFALSSMHVPS
nr:uncharacterized protein LOC109164434 [Ipomoea trifida]